MQDTSHRAVLLVALLVTTALAGCVGDMGEGLRSSEADQATVRLYIQPQNTDAYSKLQATVAHAGLRTDANQSTSLQAAGSVDLLGGSSSDPVRVATGTVDPGNYTAFTITLGGVQATHDGEDVNLPSVTRSVRVQVSFPAKAGSTTSLFLALDLEGAVQDGKFQPQASFLGARLDGEVILRADEGTTEPQGKPPVARMQIFNGTGAKVFGSDFVADDGQSQPVKRKATITLVASDSRDRDGTIESFQWVFSDGTTKEGSTVDHVFEEGGVQGVRLQVTDDDGNTDHLTVAVPVRFLVEEDGEVRFENSTSGELTAGASGLENEEGVTYTSHTFTIPDFTMAKEESSSSSGDHSSHGHDHDSSFDDPTDWDLPVHGGGGHGVPEGKDPGNFRKLAQATFTLNWSDTTDEYRIEVTREDSSTTLATASGSSPLEVQLTQLDGYYLDGGNYTVTVYYTQGIQGAYDLSVQGTYLPVPVAGSSGGH